MPDRTVAVVTDSVCGLDSRTAAEFGVYLIPVRVRVGDATFADGRDYGPERAIAAIQNGENVETAEPDVLTFAAAYLECANAGATSIVSVHVSGTLSKTVEAARQAALTSPIPVTVVDTGTTGMAQGYAALAAGAVSLQGGGSVPVAEAARATASSSRVYFTVDTLEFLRRSGRISGAVAALGSLLKVRPVLSIHDGDVAPIDRQRGTSSARANVLERAQKDSAGMARPVGAVGLVGASAAEAGLTLSIDGPTLESNPPTSLAIHAGPGMFYASVADMPQAYLDVLASVSLHA